MPVREHLRRLENVWAKNPIYFLTVCVAHHRKILAHQLVAEILIESWQTTSVVHGWAVGQYVIMPDHVHFFARPHPDAKTLSAYMRDWKKWTTRKISHTANPDISRGKS